MSTASLTKKTYLSENLVEKCKEYAGFLLFVGIGIGFMYPKILFTMIALGGWYFLIYGCAKTIRERNIRNTIHTMWWSPLVVIAISVAVFFSWMNVEHPDFNIWAEENFSEEKIDQFKSIEARIYSDISISEKEADFWVITLYEYRKDGEAADFSLSEILSHESDEQRAMRTLNETVEEWFGAHDTHRLSFANSLLQSWEKEEILLTEDYEETKEKLENITDDDYYIEEAEAFLTAAAQHKDYVED